MTRRAAAWAFAAAVCGGVWAFTGTTAAAAVFFAAAVPPLASVLLTIAAARRVSVRLCLPADIRKAEPAAAYLEVKNRSAFPLVRVHAETDAENRLTGERRTLSFDCSVPPLGVYRAGFEFGTARCGRFAFKCAEARVYDLFGLFSRGIEVLTDEKRTVLPEMFPVNVRLSGSETPLGDDVLNLNRRGGDYSEPFQIRDYAEGDGAKQIHWKLSRKLDRYLVRDPSVAIERALLIFWDKSAEPKPAAADALAEAVMSVCLFLAEREIPYSLALGGGENPVLDVTAADDLYGAVHELLVSRQGGGVPELTAMLGGRRFPLIACFASAVPERLAELSALGKTTLFLCAEDGGGGEAADGTAHYVFSPADYRGVLRDITI
ncbi:MAG: DUF58 domain-containing protein [Oscillospiraceae bacterium]|nr:DUF58 domain-containing protein [Oscillospiraceae bacterium]